ncbi:hypothetical protein [Acinetobacter sp. c1-l78]|uniref:hypothetical protein n=1 Tax=Acinetobacter sp. c1-l78 TaxID=3342803 RepID=UPI0035BB82C3
MNRNILAVFIGLSLSSQGMAQTLPVQPHFNQAAWLDFIKQTEQDSLRSTTNVQDQTNTNVVEHNTQPTAQPIMPPTVQKTRTEYQTVLGIVPKIIDDMPTILPINSDQAVVPTLGQSKDRTWIDRKHYKIHDALQKYAHSIDDWFGETNEFQPAYANLRIINDYVWNDYDGGKIKPRVRGKIKLPTLENRFSVVFGDDSLDNQIRNGASVDVSRGTATNMALPPSTSPSTPPTNTTANHQNNLVSVDRKQTRTENASLALRWERFKNPWGIKTDVDLGVRSTDDIFLRFEAHKDWKLRDDYNFYAEQIYRYGIKSEHYLRTNLELRHSRPNNAFLSDQFSLTYTDRDTQEFVWDNRAFRQHQFFAQNWFNYGVYTGGAMENGKPKLDRYGPFMSWRQPVWRDWLFVQAEVNYFNDKPLNRKHYLGTLLRFETWF